MARVNVGVNPEFLSDQHLIAESVEITMITGGLRMNDYLIKSPIPPIFNIGTGHINFFKNKILYLQNRLEAVNMELSKRNIRNSTYIDLDEFPNELVNDWSPTLEASGIIRERIYDRLLFPKKAKLGFHKYCKGSISNIKLFAERMKQSELFYV